MTSKQVQQLLREEVLRSTHEASSTGDAAGASALQAAILGEARHDIMGVALSLTGAQPPTATAALQTLQALELLLKVEESRSAASTQRSWLVPLRHLYLQWTLAQRFTDQAMAKGTVWATLPLHTHDPVPAAVCALGAFAAWRAGAGRAAGCSNTLLPPTALPSSAVHVQDTLVPCTLRAGTAAAPLPVLLPGEEAATGALPPPQVHGEGGSCSLPSAALLKTCFPFGPVTAGSAASLVPAIHKLGEACRMATTALAAARRASDSPRAHHAHWVASAGAPPHASAAAWPPQPHVAQDWRDGWAHLEHAVPVAHALALGQWLQGQFPEAITDGVVFLHEAAAADAAPWLPARSAAALGLARDLGAMLRVLLRCGLAQPMLWHAADGAVPRLQAHMASGGGASAGAAARRSSRGAGAMLSQSSWTMSQSQSQGGRPRHSSKRFRSYLGNQDDSDDSDDTAPRGPQASVSDSESVSAGSAGTGSTRSSRTGSTASLHSAQSAASPTDTASLSPGHSAVQHTAAQPADSGQPAAGAEAPHQSNDPPLHDGAGAASSVGASSSSVHSAVSLRRGVAALSEWCACPPPPQAHLPPPPEEDADVVHGSMLEALAACVSPLAAQPPPSSSLQLDPSGGGAVAAGIAVRCRSAVAGALQHCLRALSGGRRQGDSHLCARSSPRCALWHCAAAAAAVLLARHPHAAPEGVWPLLVPCAHEACTAGGSRDTPFSALEGVLQAQWRLGGDEEALGTLAALTRGRVGHVCPSLLLPAAAAAVRAAPRQRIVWACARHWLAVYRAVRCSTPPAVFPGGGSPVQAAALQGALAVMRGHLAQFRWEDAHAEVPCSKTARAVQACIAAQRFMSPPPPPVQAGVK